MGVAHEGEVVIIGGCGHVGLPLGIALADAGCGVTLYDTDPDRIQMVASGRMPFTEHGAEPLLKKVSGQNLRLSDSLEVCSKASNIIISIGTPVDKYLNPEFLPVIELVDDMMAYIHDGQNIILRSTVYPGTSKAVAGLLEAQSKGVHVSFCPERIVQGHAISELRELPQIVSSFSAEGLRMSTELFQHIAPSIVEVGVIEAELAKLFSNAWRYIQFSIANQFFMISEEAGAEFSEVHRAMTTDYSRAKDFPKAGFAAGPCLLKDTLQLSAFNNNSFLLGHAAMLINEGLPNFLTQQIKNKVGSLEGRTVGILGMAFKADIDDIRDALSFKLRKLLQFSGSKVLCSDEYVRSEQFVSAEELIDESEIIIVGVPHSAYKGLSVPADKHVVDLWSVLGRDG